MLHLNHIRIIQYKNYEYFDLNIKSNIVGICGKNGIGKTNLLDAIYYGCFTKSYFTASDQLCVRKGFDGFRIELDFSDNNNPEKVVCVLRGSQKKEILLNDIPYEKFSAHIGKFPVVMIAPDDIELIIDGSELRRRFIDTMISQVDANYLSQLITYNKILQQRNSLLKNWHYNPDFTLLEVLDEQLIAPATYIYTVRHTFLEGFLKAAVAYYLKISGESYEPGIVYRSSLHNTDFKTLLKSSLERDIYLQRTTTGIHRDDLILTLGEQPFKQIASQGQKKSLLFALKLAEYDFICRERNNCILLLDDVFEKLDAQRMSNLLNWVCSDCKGQVFITDTHRERLENGFASTGIKAQILNL
jgi:DNA replication and repair protein RecF